MIQKGSIRARRVGGLAVVDDRRGLRRCVGPPVHRRRPARPRGRVHIGFANGGGVGNGWREAMICSVKAQAVASGNVTRSPSSTTTRTRPAS